MRRTPSIVLLTAALTLAIGAAGCSEQRVTSSSTSTTTTAACSPTTLLACAAASSMADLVPARPTKATGTPITIGMINQENTPAGSFPELSAAAKGMFEWLDAEAGGVDGHPIVLDVCNTNFSAEGSTACGQRFAQAKVPVVLGGIDVFGNAVDTLRASGIPYAGGIPVSQQSMANDNSFQWSGGSWGAAVAFAQHAAVSRHAKKVAIVYGDFGSVADSAHYAERTLRHLGASSVQLVPYPIVATDLGAPMQAAWASHPDAIFVLAADTGCGAAFNAAHTIGVTAAMYYVGACAAPTITTAAGNASTEGAYFNVEGPVDPDHPDPDVLLYNSVLAAHAPGLNPIGAATVSARSAVNLYRIMKQVGADHLDAATLTTALRGARDLPSFMGHAWSCDTKQLAGLPAACSPQQILVQIHDGKLSQVGDWIDVGAVYPG